MYEKLLQCDDMIFLKKKKIIIINGPSTFDEIGIDLNWNNDYNVTSYIKTFKTFKSNNMKYSLMPKIRKFNSKKKQWIVFLNIKINTIFLIFIGYMWFNMWEMVIQLLIIWKFH